MTDFDMRRSREILAERMGWPDGALQTCLDLEGRNPGWHVAWLNENTFKGFERDAGFWASLTGQHAVDLYSADPVELEERMRSVPEHNYGIDGCAYCLSRADARMQRALLESELSSRSRLRGR